MEDITFTEIISYAKVAEGNAKKFYLDAAANAAQSNVRELLEALAGEEQKHIEHLDKLQKNIEERGTVPPVTEHVRALGYADYIKPVSLDADATYRDVLEAAMMKEKESIKTYETLSRYVDDEQAKQHFEFLAEEERRHLKKFEVEYDDLDDQMN